MKNWLLVVTALALLAVEVSASGGPLTNLCKGKSFELKTVSDLYPLIHELKSGQIEGCSEAAKGSVLDLEPIIMAENVCSIEVAKHIGRYYEKYASKKSLYRWTLSSSVREYFLAISFEISRLCEQALMDHLVKDGFHRIYMNEATEWRNFNDKLNGLADVIGGIERRIQNLFIVTNMEGIKGVKKENNLTSLVASQTVAVDSEVKNYIDKIKSLCRNKFKPIYEKLIQPLVILANVGFEYTSGEVEKRRVLFRDGDSYRKWYAAVIVCESTLGQKVIEAPVASKEVDRDGMTVLDSEDLAKLSKENPEVITSSPAAQVAAADEPSPYELNVRLKPGFNLHDSEIKWEMKTVGSKRREAKKLRKTVLKRLVSDFEQVIASDRFKVGLASDSDYASGLDQTYGEEKLHWKKRALIFAVSILTIVGAFACPPMAYVGIVVLGALAIGKIFKTAIEM